MDWLFPQNSKETMRSVDSVGRQNDSPTPTYPGVDFSNEVFTNLKKNYEERIRHLESQIRTTHDVIESDDVLQTMKLSRVSDDFRKQRVQEIIEDSMGAEKEEEIEKLNKINACLRAEIGAMEQDNQRVRQFFEQEANKFQGVLNELKNALQVESQGRIQLQEENQKLAAAVNQLMNEKKGILADKDSQVSQQSQAYEKEIQRLRAEINEMKTGYSQTEEGRRKKDELFEVVNRDHMQLQGQYGALENAHKKLQEELNKQGKELSRVQELYKTSCVEVDELRGAFENSEARIRDLERELENSMKEKTEVLDKSEYVSSKIKEIIAKEQRDSSMIIEDMKNKFKVKIEEHKTQIMDLSMANEALVKENMIMKEELEESKMNCDKIIAVMKNDMRYIKNEWENRCHEIELASEKAIAELKFKHQNQINQLQNEYQQLVSRRMQELQHDTGFQLNPPRSIDAEVRTQLENRIAQIEKDYILKTKHENILSTEIMELKARHAQEVSNIEERHERDMEDRIREIKEKNILEYKSNNDVLTAQVNFLEQELSKIKAENHKLTSNYNIEAEKARRLEIELEEYDIHKKNIKDELKEAKDALHKTKTLYQKGNETGQAQAEQIDELNNEIAERERIIEELNGNMEALNNELAELREINQANEDKLENTGDQILTLHNEIDSLNHKIDVLEREKEALNEQIRELDQDLTETSKKLNNEITNVRTEEGEKAEKVIKELHARLFNSEEEMNLLSQENGAKDKRLEEQAGLIQRLENTIVDLQKGTTELEGALARSQSECKEVVKQMQNVKEAVRSGLSIGSGFVGNGLMNLREEVENIREALNIEVQRSKETTEDLVSQIIQAFQDRIARVTSTSDREKDEHLLKVTREYETRLHEQERLHSEEREKQQVLNEKYEQENVRIQEELDQHRQETQKLIQNYKNALHRIEEENKALIELSQQKTREIQELQLYTNREIARMKEETGIMMTQQVGQVQAKYNDELKLIVGVIDEMKMSNLLKLQKFEEMVAEVQDLYASSLNEVKNSYEENLQKYDKENTEIIGELEAKETEVDSLRKELQDLYQKYQELQKENVQAFEAFEQKIMRFRELVKKEDDEKRAKSSAKEDTDDKLKQELAELRKDAELKDYKIEELTRIKKSLKEDVIRYQQALEQKDRILESQQKESKKAGRQRDKEIEELQELLKKSIDSFNSTLDNNMRIASKLDKDTQEIAKTVRSTTRQEYRKRPEVYDYKK